MNWFPKIFCTMISLHAGVTAVDSNGVVRHPFASNGRHGTVLIFVAVDCPISNGYAPELKKIVADFSKKGIDFNLVYADSSTSAADVKKHLAAYGYDCTALLDPKQDLVKLVGVKVTPEVAVFDSIGGEVYHGRIDDLYADFGKKKYNATTHELRSVLDELSSDHKVTRKSTDAVGCPI